MRIREFPKIKWQEWLQPPMKTGSGFRYPPPDIGDCILKGVKYYPKDQDKPDHLSLDLEDKSKKQKFSVVHLFEDSDFASHLCKKLEDDCIGMTMREIGEVELK